LTPEKEVASQRAASRDIEPHRDAHPDAHLDAQIDALMRDIRVLERSLTMLELRIGMAEAVLDLREERLRPAPPEGGR